MYIRNSKGKEWREFSPNKVETAYGTQLEWLLRALSGQEWTTVCIPMQYAGHVLTHKLLLQRWTKTFIIKEVFVWQRSIA
jgi:hypothetical protein